MKSRQWVVWGVMLGGAVGLGYGLWRCSKGRQLPPMEISPTRTRERLEQAAPLLRLPTSSGRPPEVLKDGSGIRCPITGSCYPYRNGILHLLGAAQEKTFTQRALDTSVTAWGYDRFRGWITKALDAPDFALEVAKTQHALQVQAGDTVLDIACGHGNFTVEWAKRAGASGLIIGLDYSLPMLRRAAYHVNRWGLENVLLVHGDAHHLPFAEECFQKINCSGGFHQFPDLTQVLQEISRVGAKGGVLTASTFAEGPNDPHAGLKRWMKRYFDLHFVPLVALGKQLERLGYDDCQWELPGGGWFGYVRGRKTT